MEVYKTGELGILCSRNMKTGKYIVLEGPEGVGKTTVAAMAAHELERLGIPVRVMHEPDGKADATTREIRRLTQDPDYPMNTRTEVLLYNAARSQSLEAVRTARDSGEVVIVDRSYLTTLAVQFYGRGDIQDYQRLNDIIAFAVGDMWPDLTIVLDAPVDVLQKRTKKRGEHERFDSLSTEMLERIRAGYLWEAKQRNMPVVYATGRADETFTEVWRHIAQLLELDGEAASEPVAVAELLAKSPAAQVLKAKQSAQSNEMHETYYIPPTLPDDMQCDYCDDIERILSARRKLATSLTNYLHQDEQDSEGAWKKAEDILRPLLPVACAPESFRTFLSRTEHVTIPEDIQKTLPNGFSSSTVPVRLVSVSPRNELDLLPAMLYETLDLPLNEVKETVEKWSYEVKSHLFQAYLKAYPRGKALQSVRYEFDLLAASSDVVNLPDDLLEKVRLQTLTPRYGYDTPPEVEAAGLSDDYDAIFDQSLALQSTLQARGFTAESQHATLLGHKQRWSIAMSYNTLRTSAIEQLITSALQETHPLLSKKIDRDTRGR